jgi:hypothetical protein
MGAQLLHHGRRQQQGNLGTSGGNIQEMLPKPPLLAQIVLWPLENQQNRRLPPPMSAQITLKPPQHLQDQTRASQLLRADVPEHHHRLQASNETEAKTINKLLQPLEVPQLLHCNAQAHRQRELEKRLAEARARK